MKFLIGRFTRSGALLAVLGALVGVLTIGAGQAAAASLSYTLLPAPGTFSVGGGVVTLTPAGTAMQVHIDLTGARPNSTYTVSLCTNTGYSYSCPSTSSVVSDVTGAVHADAFVAALAQTDLVALTNVVDASDGYQAVTGTAPIAATQTQSLPFYGTPLPAGSQILADGTILAPEGSTVTSFDGCPAGFHGIVAIGAPGQTVYTYQYSPFFGLITAANTAQPLSTSTAFVYC